MGKDLERLKDFYGIPLVPPSDVADTMFVKVSAIHFVVTSAFLHLVKVLYLPCDFSQQPANTTQRRLKISVENCG